ncbi:LamG domain-containing protein [Sinorhizobium fredii]|uniref:LamG domain-containing protein n=1 Tax=Rhizobium fredii TaxID=380 RepID=UPI0035146F44
MNMTTFDASLHCGFNGVDGATTSTDESNSAHTLTFNNQAQLDTGVKKFGTASLELDGADDYVSAGTSVDWQFGSGAFTIEGWIYITDSTSVGSTLAAVWNPVSSNRSWQVLVDSSDLVFKYRTTADVDNTVTTNSNLVSSLSTWYHIAVDRSSDGFIRLYVNGAMQTKSNVGTSVAIKDTTSTRALTIGADSNLADDLAGRVDELRITKGVARYASDSGFTVPTTAYPRS